MALRSEDRSRLFGRDGEARKKLGKSPPKIKRGLRENTPPSTASRLRRKQRPYKSNRTLAELMQFVTVYSAGLCSLSCCADNSITIEEITTVVNVTNPTGIQSHWRLAEDKKFKSGEPNPCPCDENPEHRKHYLFHC